VRERIGRTPLLVKIGHLADDELAEELVESVSGIVDGLAMTNSIAAVVSDAKREQLFDGQQRGICGAAILAGSTAQVGRFSRIISAVGSDLTIVAVGGIRRARHILEYCDAGARSFQLATAAMLRPAVGWEIRREMASRADLREELSACFLRETPRLNTME